MLRHAGISEIYTRGHPLLPLSPSTERACLPIRNLHHVPSCLVSVVFYRLPFLSPLLPLFLSLSRFSRPAVSATELYSDLYF